MRSAAKRVINICMISTVLLFITCSNSSTFAAWPEVKEVKESYHFENVDEASFDITISGINGQALYELKCHNADYEKDKDFNYSGAFECRLKSLYSKEAVSTLLTDNPRQSADWESRGRYLTEHLLGECADYKDWGRTRIFRLRGMKITLYLSSEKIEIDSQKKQATLKFFNFTVSVEKDSSAKTSIADRSSVKEPSWFYNPAQCLEHALKKEGLKREEGKGSCFLQ